MLALATAELLLDLGLDVLLRREDLDLALDVDQHRAEAVLHGERLEQRLALGHRDIEIAGHEIGEPTRLGDLVEHLIDRVLGQPALLRELRRPCAHLAVQRDEVGILSVEWRQLDGRRDRREQIAIDRRHANADAAVVAFEHEARPAEAALDLADRGDRAELREVLRRDILALVVLRDDKHAVIGVAQRGLDGPERARASCRDG